VRKIRSLPIVRTFRAACSFRGCSWYEATAASVINISECIQCAFSNGVLGSVTIPPIVGNNARLSLLLKGAFAKNRDGFFAGDLASQGSLMNGFILGIWTIALVLEAPNDAAVSRAFSAPERVSFGA
jgi:hypothetical protein